MSWHKKLVADYAAEASPAFLLCRSLQHSWDEGTSEVDHVGREIHWTMSCGRCATRRTQVLTRDGFRARTFYAYPKGYRIKGADILDQASRAKLRLAALDVLAP